MEFTGKWKKNSCLINKCLLESSETMGHEGELGQTSPARFCPTIPSSYYHVDICDDNSLPGGPLNSFRQNAVKSKFLSESFGLWVFSAQPDLHAKKVCLGVAYPWLLQEVYRLLNLFVFSLLTYLVLQGCLSQESKRVGGKLFSPVPMQYNTSILSGYFSEFCETYVPM